MPKETYRLLIALVALLCLGCSDKSVDPPDPDPPEPPFAKASAAEKSLLNSSTSFGLNLFREIVDDAEAADNLFISPLSVSVALGMALNGADRATLDSMRSTLEMADLSMEDINESYRNLISLLVQADPQVMLEIANSIWYRDGLPVENEFIDLNKTFFDALVTQMKFSDPAAADIINAWVNEKTHGKIPEIVDNPISPELVMFLINAVYFKATWTAEFDESATHDATFTLPDGSNKPCRMMAQGGNFSYFDNELFQAVDLPYGSELFSMAVFLPRPDVGVDSVASQFNLGNWENWTASFAIREGDLYLPRFRFSYELTLNQALMALGMGIAFDPREADFTRICPDLFISEVRHKSFVQVNEEGTEAAAVTSIGFGMTSNPDNKFFMHVDRPFLFVIWERESGAIVFMGRVADPVYD